MSSTAPSSAPTRTPAQWVALWLVVAVVMAGCVLAGRWQWNRHVDRDAAIDVITTNYAAEPVPLAQILPDAGVTVPAEDVWRSVRVSGRYEADAAVLLRNRPVDSQPAVHVLVPFVTDAGTVLVVNRGWMQYGLTTTAADAPAPPSGQVEIVVRLRADEPASSRGAPSGQVQAINTAQVLAAGPRGADWAEDATYGAYGALASEEPAPAAAPRTLPAPDTDPRSHLSYAFQWWVFAAGAGIGAVVLVRREKQERVIAELGGAPHPFGGPSETVSGRARSGEDARSRRRGPSAEDVEDDLISARQAR